MHLEPRGLQRSHVREAAEARPHDDDSRELSKTFRLEQDAKDFEAKVRLAKRAGELGAVDAGRVTLDRFAERWWAYAASLAIDVCVQSGSGASAARIPAHRASRGAPSPFR